MRRRTSLIATAILLFVSNAPAQKSTGGYLAFVGSYTHPTLTTTSASKGIYAFRFDSKSGTLSPLGIAAEAVNLCQPGAPVGITERKVSVCGELAESGQDGYRSCLPNRSHDGHAHIDQ